MALVYEPHTIKERLEVLYQGEDVVAAYEGIKELIEKYKTRVSSKPYHMTEKDVILITYADNVQNYPEPPLETLKNFLNKHVEGIINSVHILPFYPFSSDDGFSVVNYSEVDPHFGSWNEVEELSKHFRLMFDGVINHVSQFSDWFKAYMADDPNYADFFIDLDPATDLHKVVRPRATPLLHEFKSKSGRIRNIWTTFSRDQVDLNYSNYKVLLAVLDALFFYIENGATLIRLDAIAFVWKKIGTECVHLSETHEIIQLMREVLHEVAPEVIIITETNVPHKENISYFGSGDDEAQMVYNFSLPPLIAYSILSGNASKMTQWAKTLSLPSDKVCFFNFTASHDGVGLRPVSGILDNDEIALLEESAKASGGLVSYRTDSTGNKKPYELNCSYIDVLTPPEGTQELRLKRMMVAQAIMLAMPGVPGIYFHSLFGSRNFHQGVKMSGQNRSINREKLNAGHITAVLEKDGTLERGVFYSYKRLLSIRTSEKAFNPFGAFHFKNLDERLFIIHHMSIDCSENIFAIHNVSDQEVTLTLPDYITLPAFELVNDTTITSDTFTLQAYDICWIKCKVDKEICATISSQKVNHENN